MKPTFFQSSICGFSRFQRILAGIFMGLVFVQAVLAQTYVNNQNEYYSVPGPPTPPQINDTGFDNENIFSVSYETFVNNQIIFSEPWWGTLYYTNNGQLIVNAPIIVSEEDVISLDTLTSGVGFEFDLQQNSGNTMAGTFYSPGDVYCDSILTGNNVIQEPNGLGGVEDFFFPTSIGGCIVSATNIIVPGTIEVGIDGQLTLNGQNVNLSRSVLTMENAEELEGLNLEGNAPFTGTGESGVYTNIWDPQADLTEVSALSADFPLFPLGFQIEPSTPYNAQAGLVNRSAFVEDISGSNVTYSVWFGTPATITGSGEVAVGWTGTYLNYATGQYLTNYLYLNDDYLAGAVTNVPLGPFGYPDNFTLTESATPLITATPSPPGLPDFPPGGITNNTYVYGDFLSESLIQTNPSGVNPSGSITDLTSRVVVNASSELNLSFAQISGANYLSINAPNQFDDNGGSQVQSLFSDLNLGATNGSINISNVLDSQIPDWTGTIEAWSTRWLATETNFVGTNAVLVTNDWRTVLVFSDLDPLTGPQVRNLTVNATNNVNISDELNIYGSLFISAQSLNLTTNLIGVGAASPVGELNLANASSSTWNWLGSFPNLLWLTNNGAIIMPAASDILSSMPTNTVTPGAPATSATATLAEGNGSNVAKKSTVTIGTQTYTFTNSITSKSPPYVVFIGASFDASLTNLIAAINYGTGAGKVYSTNKAYANGFVTAGKLTNHTFTVTSIDAGPVGNVIPVSVTATNLAWNSPELSGGSNAMPATTNLTVTTVPLNTIVNSGVFSDFGSIVWVDNFVNGGFITNGPGSFLLTSLTTTMTNGVLYAGGDISINAGSLLTSNLLLQAGRGLTLNITNSISDYDVTNGNIWTVDDTNGTGFDGLGLVLPMLPASTDPSNNLLGTTIYIQSPPPNKAVTNIWAGRDYGASTNGYYTNNVAIGQLSLDALGQNSQLYFTGTATNGATNAIYVDRLILNHYASYANGEGTANIPSLLFNTNLVIYYADAVASSNVNGGPLEEVSYQLNHSNTNHLQWVPEYVGYFSSTNLAYPGGVTEGFNVGLLESPLDSDGYGVDGLPVANAQNPYPFFIANEINFQQTITKSGVQLTWCSIPSSTNYVYYSTNMLSWALVSSFVSPSRVPPVGGWPITNTLHEPFSSSHGYYRVRVSPNSADVFGQ